MIPIVLLSILNLALFLQQKWAILTVLITLALAMLFNEKDYGRIKTKEGRKTSLLITASIGIICIVILDWRMSVDFTTLTYKLGQVFFLINTYLITKNEIVILKNKVNQ